MKLIDADKLRAEIERLYDSEAPKHDQQCDFDDGYFTGIDTISRFLDSLQQEQPSEICSKCIHHGKDDGYCYNPHGGMQSLINENGVYECTGFCEQEQQEEPSKGLDVTDFCKPIDPGIAQCVADHWWEMMGEEPDKSLEEAAEKSSAQYYKDAGYSPFPNVETAAHKSDFARHFAKWQKEQMLKDAVEGLICATVTETNAISFLSPLPKELKAGDKVRIIIVKEGGND